MNCYYFCLGDCADTAPSWRADRIVIERDEKKRPALKALLEELHSGDALIVRSFASVGSNSAEFLKLMALLIEKEVAFVSLQEQVDTTGEAGQYLVSVCRALIALNREELAARHREGVARAQADGKYKGRKPIFVDDELFAGTIERWQRGEISAKQAMQEHNLKPNTFYRRVRALAERNRSTIKTAAKELREEIKNTVIDEKKILKP